MIEQAVETGSLAGRLEHRRRAVRQDAGNQAGPLQALQHGGHFGETGKVEIEVHQALAQAGVPDAMGFHGERSEEHTSELQSLMRISYAVFCLKKKNEEKLVLTPIQ